MTDEWQERYSDRTRSGRRWWLPVPLEAELVEEGENTFPTHGRLSPDQERIRQLERENEILRQERDIPNKQWPSSHA
jgi:hypothetical protein